MKIIVWGINYRPEPTGIAPFNAGLADFLAGAAHEVSVVTGFAYYPQWRKAPADRGRLYRTDRVGGVAVHRCWLYVPRRPSTARRILHELSFGLASLLRVLFLRRADVYVVVSPPLLLGGCAWLASRLKFSRYVFHVQDLQPDAAVGLGMVKGRGFVRVLYALERFAYRHAAAVSGISHGMLAAFAGKGVPEERRIHFPNWVRAGLYPEAIRGARQRLGLPPEAFLAVYSGNLGRKQGIGVLVDAAELLARDAGAPPGVIVIAGDGAEREALERRVAELRLPTLRLLPLLPEADYAALLAAADLGLITEMPDAGRFFFPSKLLSLLQAGLPVLAVAGPDSELARAIAAGGFGIRTGPGRAGDLASGIRRLAADPAECTRLRAATAWVRQFDPGVVLSRFDQRLRRLVNPAAAARSFELAAERPEIPGP